MNDQQHILTRDDASDLLDILHFAYGSAQIGKEEAEDPADRDGYQEYQDLMHPWIDRCKAISGRTL